ncbi:MAG: toll/interleukin-1 receptor domain-containing protein [Clostridia bacterium]|nr:toll/interleukin-1 receptor domain-containing protein [Clostridia bacterium]
MAILKCKMCGAALNITNETVVTCDYCDNLQTLPKLDDEQRVNMYDRADHFRRNNEYDKAMGIYEQILNQDTTDAEAYWSLVLCKYGIEYVEENGKRVPTVNRAQFTSVLADEDYRAAIEYADVMQRPVYEAEARVIDEIQKGILSISENEQPFDVFICYKETDANGRRTIDSAIAAELYQELTREGFKVFFARITLEDKLGTAYEPYIFAALNSAKVMVVIGTKKEHFEAVWVKNEWSRYLALIKNGAQKKLIPAYRDMSPYDLPDEFSHLQAQDMAKLGFMHDLVHGIKKLTAKDEPKMSAAKETVITAGTAASTAPLLKRAFIFLEDGEWKSADEYCEKVLDIDPECGEAYLGKLMAETKVKKKELLKKLPKPFDTNKNYSKILKYSDEETVQTLKGYVEYINKRIEQERLGNAYTAAINCAALAETEADFLKAADMFGRIRDYADSADQERRCREIAELTKQEEIQKKQEARYKTAVNVMRTAKTSDSLISAEKTFREIGGYKDSDELAEKCKILAVEYRAKEEAEKQARIEAENKARIESQKKEEERRKAEEEQRSIRLKQQEMQARRIERRRKARNAVCIILWIFEIALVVLSVFGCINGSTEEPANQLTVLAVIFVLSLGASMLAVILRNRDSKQVFCVISIVITVFFAIGLVVTSAQYGLVFDKKTIGLVLAFDVLNILNMLLFYKD